MRGTALPVSADDGTRRQELRGPSVGHYSWTVLQAGTCLPVFQHHFPVMLGLGLGLGFGGCGLGLGLRPQIAGLGLGLGGLGLGLRPQIAGLGLGLGLGGCGLGLGLESDGVGLGLGLDMCGLVNITATSIYARSWKEQSSFIQLFHTRPICRKTGGQQCIFFLY